ATDFLRAGVQTGGGRPRWSRRDRPDDLRERSFASVTIERVPPYQVSWEDEDSHETAHRKPRKAPSPGRAFAPDHASRPVVQAHDSGARRTSSPVFYREGS